MTTIKEYNKQVRKVLGVPITIGFEFSHKAYYCQIHGFQDEVKLEVNGKDCFGFGNSFIAKCPICRKQLISIKHTCETCKYYETCSYEKNNDTLCSSYCYDKELPTIKQ